MTALLFLIAIIIKPDENELEINNQGIGHFYPQILIGMCILFLTLIRIIIKRIYPDRRPPNINYFNPVHKKIARIVYSLIYVFLFFIPLVGLTIFYQINSFTNNTNLFIAETTYYYTLLNVQKFSIIIFIFLIFIHISYLLYYSIKSKENIFKRMLF